MAFSSGPWLRLMPLVLATMASQSLLVVLAPTMVATAAELEASEGVVGQARSVTAGVAIAASVVIGSRVQRLGVRAMVRRSAGLAVVASGVVAVSPTLPVFLAAHVLVGMAFAGLLTAGFAGLASFAGKQRRWALGYVAGANALAWVIANPLVGGLTDWASWRLAYAVPAGLALAALLAAGGAAAIPAGSAPPRMRTVFADPSARRWMTAELMAYGAWTAVLTFIGAFLIGRLGVTEASAGWFLAGGAAAYFAASTHSGALMERITPRKLTAVCALVMAALVAAQFSVASVPSAVAIFCLTGLTAGIRTPAATALALQQRADHPGAMMAARTAVTQLGYLVGAVIGGAVIVGAGYGTLGGVLAAGMVVSALLVLRVGESSVPSPTATERLTKRVPGPPRA